MLWLAPPAACRFRCAHLAQIPIRAEQVSVLSKHTSHTRRDPEKLVENVIRAESRILNPRKWPSQSSRTRVPNPESEEGGPFSSESRIPSPESRIRGRGFKSQAPNPESVPEFDPRIRNVIKSQITNPEAGPKAGIGWGLPSHDPESHISNRRMGLLSPPHSESRSRTRGWGLPSPESQVPNPEFRIRELLGFPVPNPEARPESAPESRNAI